MALWASLMNYIKPDNLIFHNDALDTLKVLREHAMACEGDASLREGIIIKIDARIAQMKASVFEREEANGDMRIRHPSIGVMCVNHERLEQPTQLFAAHIKSLVAFTITISRADAIIGKDGLVRYEPYEVITKLMMSEAAYAELITSPGSGRLPGTFEVAKHYRVDPYLPDAMANQRTLLARSVEGCLEGTQEWTSILTNLIDAVAQKPSKPSVKAADEIRKYTSMVEGSVVASPSYGLRQLAEFAEVVKAHSQQEIEALIAFHQAQKENI